LARLCSKELNINDIEFTPACLTVLRRV